MPKTLVKEPSRGRLFKIFTDLGPYFRKLESDENNFFFDCLEICVDVKKEPENRTFLGWWIRVKRQGDKLVYERFDGLYDIDGNWTEKQLNKKQKLQIDKSFDTFIKKLTEVIDVEVECELASL